MTRQNEVVYFPLDEREGANAEATVHHAVCYSHPRIFGAFLNDSFVELVQLYDADPWRTRFGTLEEVVAKARLDWVEGDCKLCALALLNNGPVVHGEKWYPTCKTVEACCIYSVRKEKHPDWNLTKHDRRKMGNEGWHGDNVGLYVQKFK